MSHSTMETVGVRYTGWAALDKDPQEDMVEYTCPQCGAKGEKRARRPKSEYHFSDGFVQDERGERSVCRNCRQSLHVAPVVMVHDRDEDRRFHAVFIENAELSNN